VSRLAERRARVARSCDRALAEFVRITPMKTGGAVLGAPDPANPPYATVAIYREVSALQEVHGVGAGRGQKMEARGARRGLSFALGAVGCPGKPLPQAGWHVTLIEREGQPAFRFIPASASAQGRISYDLVPLGATE
jgi:hypothetical protein